MMTFILASGNSHKAEEFKELFQGVIQVHPAPKTLDVDETGKTFTENAFLKAQAYYESYKAPALADDSGLIVEALPDILGVQSARFAPELKTYPEKCHKLIDLLKTKENHSAYFVCVLCFYISPDEVYFFENEPLIIGSVNKHLPAVKIIFMNSTHSSKRPSPTHLPTITPDSFQSIKRQK